MKNLSVQHVRRALATLFITFFIVSCEKEQLTQQDPASSDRSLIQSLGFDVSDLRDMGDFYLVEGDIMLMKNKLREYESVASVQDRYNGRTEHTTNGQVSLANQRNISVFVDNTVPVTAEDNWRAELQSAVNALNSVQGCRIRLQIVNAPPADITVRADNGALADCNLCWNGSAWVCCYTLAAAEWPVSGQAGFQVRLNLDANNNFVFNAAQKQFTITHELGHCIGFVHTNAAGLNEGSGTPVPGTPTSGSNPDPGSFMNGGNPMASWSDFSYYDRIALRTVYPAMTTTISGPAFGTNSGTYTWKALTPVNGIGPFTHVWHYGYDGVNYNGFFGSGTSVTAQLPNGRDLYLRLTTTASDGEVAVDFHTTQQR
jgi:hypothetical protein